MFLGGEGMGRDQMVNFFFLFFFFSPSLMICGIAYLVLSACFFLYY